MQPTERDNLRPRQSIPSDDFDDGHPFSHSPVYQHSDQRDILSTIIQTIQLPKVSLSLLAIVSTMLLYVLFWKVPMVLPPVFVKETALHPFQPINLHCKQSAIKDWNSTFRNSTTANNFLLQKLPYQGLSIVLGKGQDSPSDHYTELVMWLKGGEVNESLYIDSAPLYLILLVGASTPKDVKITVSSSIKQKQLLLTNLIVNNLEKKVIFAHDEFKLNEAQWLLTDKVQFAINNNNRPTILSLSTETKREGLTGSRLYSAKFCYYPKRLPVQNKEFLTKGTYVLNL